MKIHLIERVNEFQRISREDHIWESGNWVLSQEVSESLVGGDIYFHKEQTKQSYFGGKVLGCRIVSEGSDSGRFIIKFQASMEHKNVKTAKEGWGMEKKIVR